MGAAAARHATQAMQSRLPHASRSLHTPSAGSLRVPLPNLSSLSQRFISQTKTIVTQFFGHLTAPGPRSSHVKGSVRSFHFRPQTIQDRLSLSARTKLQAMRPMQNGGPFFPRAPPASRSVSQVGLGSARNFSTGRAVFQNLVDNVPVKGRAIYEVDWNTKIGQRRLRGDRGKKVNKKTNSAIKVEKATFGRACNPRTSVRADEMEHYFPTEAIKPVTTYLLIPLAPTPTERHPLPSDISLDPMLLRSALPEVANVHRNHELHSLRVSTLFARLDASNVWARGVQCSSYALPSVVGEGVCSVLKVEFIGWTAAEVRGVIGESGSGWCSLEEYEDEDSLSEYDSPITDDGVGPAMTSSTHSFVIPTLDFSASSGFPQAPIYESALSSPSLSDVDWSESDLESLGFSDLGQGRATERDLWMSQ